MAALWALRLLPSVRAKPVQIDATEVTVMGREHSGKIATPPNKGGGLLLAYEAIFSKKVTHSPVHPRRNIAQPQLDSFDDDKLLTSYQARARLHRCCWESLRYRSTRNNMG